MTLILDTSIVIELEKKNKDIIKKIEELSKIHYLPAQITFITYFEFLLGIKAKAPKNQEKAIAFLNKFNCLKASKKTAEILAELKHEYDNEGIGISLAEFIIASQVKENNMLLVTKDKDFEKIKEIKKVIL